MPILNDYHCGACGDVSERWTSSPAPMSLSCPACGAESRRRFAAVGLSGRSQAPRGTPGTTSSGSLCSQFPQVPGLCHMSESAGRMMVARYRGDNRAVESELSRQEKRAASQAPTMNDVVTHHHFPASPAEPATDSRP